MNLLTSSNIFLDSVKEVLAHYEEFHSQNLLKIKEVSKIAKKLFNCTNLTKELVTEDVFVDTLITLINLVFSEDDLRLLNHYIFQGKSVLGDEEKQQRKSLHQKKRRYIQKLKDIYNNIFATDHEIDDCSHSQTTDAPPKKTDASSDILLKKTSGTFINPITVTRFNL